jgi:hypothetical protein
MTSHAGFGQWDYNNNINCSTELKIPINGCISIYMNSLVIEDGYDWWNVTVNRGNIGTFSGTTNRLYTLWRCHPTSDTVTVSSGSCSTTWSQFSPNDCGMQVTFTTDNIRTDRGFSFDWYPECHSGRYFSQLAGACLGCPAGTYQGNVLRQNISLYTAASYG